MTKLIHLPTHQVCWQAAALPAAARSLAPARAGTGRIRPDEGVSSGTARWECRDGDACAWVEWDWAEVGQGMVAQTDPLGVRSNVLLLDGHGRPLLPERQRVMLATLVYLLPWQAAVQHERGTEHRLAA